MGLVEEEFVMSKKVQHVNGGVMKDSNRVWAVLSVVILALGATGNCFAQLLSQWHFDETSGTVAVDSVGGNDGTLNGDAAFVAGGISENAISVTKAGNGFVNMGDVFPMTSGNASISVWIKTAPGDQQADNVFVSRHQAGSTNGYLLGVNTTSGYGLTDKAYFYASDPHGEELISTTTVNDGEWHHIVAVYRQSGPSELYVNGGAPEDTGPAGPVIGNSAPFVAGGVHFSIPGGTWDGQIDELRVFGHALSSTEVQILYEHPAGTLIFVDGFETGDTSAWSVIVP